MEKKRRIDRPGFHVAYLNPSPNERNVITFFGRPPRGNPLRRGANDSKKAKEILFPLPSRVETGRHDCQDTAKRSEDHLSQHFGRLLLIDFGNAALVNLVGNCNGSFFSLVVRSILSYS